MLTSASRVYSAEDRKVITMGDVFPVSEKNSRRFEKYTCAAKTALSFLNMVLYTN